MARRNMGSTVEFPLGERTPWRLRITTNSNFAFPEPDTNGPVCADISREEKSSKQTINGSLRVMDFLRELVLRV